MHHERDPEAINSETRPEVGYEYRDISVKGIAQATFHFFFWSTLVIVLTYVGFYFALDLPIRPDKTPETIPSYPNPLLQGDVGVKVEISEVKRKEHEQLSQYGWVDKEKGIARIPIDKAMEEVAATGLQPTPSGEAKL